MSRCVLVCSRGPHIDCTVCSTLAGMEARRTVWQCSLESVLKVESLVPSSFLADAQSYQVVADAFLPHRGEVSQQVVAIPDHGPVIRIPAELRIWSECSVQRSEITAIERREESSNDIIDHLPGTPAWRRSFPVRHRCWRRHERSRGRGSEVRCLRTGSCDETHEGKGHTYPCHVLRRRSSWAPLLLQLQRLDLIGSAREILRPWALLSRQERVTCPNLTLGFRE
jgi:hypothetical protein